MHVDWSYVAYSFYTNFNSASKCVQRRNEVHVHENQDLPCTSICIVHKLNPLNDRVRSIFTQIAILVISAQLASKRKQEQGTYLESEIRFSPRTPSILPVEIGIWPLLIVVRNGRWGRSTLEPSKVLFMESPGLFL